MKTTTITCDSCAKDLTFTGNCVDYYLTLASASKRSRSGAVTAMMIYPPTERDYFFCGLACLDLWTARRQYIDSLAADWWTKWKREHGTWREGRCVSYPMPSDEVQGARNAGYEEKAAAQFPAFVAVSA